MNHNKYDGTIHPEVWIRQIRLSFYDQNNENTKNEQETVDYCKLLIHPSIKISSETNSFVGLVNDLKLDASYDAFKKSIKKKVQELKFNNIINKDDGDDESLKFLNNFKQLCYEGEITEIGERKRLFLTALSKGSLQHFLIDNKFDKINSMEELFKYFYESLLDEPKTVKNGSYITLKHVATGKYLSSCTDNYENGGGNLVYAGPTVPDTSCVWIIKGNQEKIRNNQLGKFLTIFYGDLFNLTNKKTEINYVSTNSENPPYVKSKDIINLQSDQFVLRSSESTFTNRSITYQEVACHKERIGGNDEWCIEIIEQSN
ncbi:hypothetical protein RhiirC2_767490 [Rhizophagus irregularis]|uniref:MIR domain-containing protein n=1 Tax=Rhizophagus irregularis TaxID=588596 RepID=A0A2N1P453_9GLOM|nr:hypothetical protein RhiirC2_767490 [Rhizophagus irregularis]